MSLLPFTLAAVAMVIFAFVLLYVSPTSIFSSVSFAVVVLEGSIDVVVTNSILDDVELADTDSTACVLPEVDVDDISLVGEFSVVTLSLRSILSVVLMFVVGFRRSVSCRFFSIKFFF